MSQELVTYSAQKVKLKALRGNYFELTINVKDSSGSAYDFSNDSTNVNQYDNAYFQVVNVSGSDMLNYYQGAIDAGLTEIILFDASITEDGKIVITSTNDNGFWPAVGIYKYHLFTQKVNTGGSTTPSQLTHWLYGDFIVEASNPVSYTHLRAHET